MKRKKLPLSLLMIRGSLGKKLVIKHYKWGVVQTKFPDMSNIKASAGQKCCRALFKKAVAYAKSVIADPVLKAAWQKKLRRPNGVYNEAVRAYMQYAKAVKQPATIKSNRLKIVYKNLFNKRLSFTVQEHIDLYIPRVAKQQAATRYRSSA